MKLYLSSLALLYGANAISSPKSECRDFIKYKAGEPQKSTRGNSDYDFSDNGGYSDYGSGESDQPSYLIFLDETGSMQKLGDPGSNEKNGRKVMIELMNKFIGGLQTDEIDGPVTLVNFNTKAHWFRYNSISEMPKFTPEIYNPGYATNLYDTLGCVLSTYAQEYPNEQNLKVYVISDGVHQMGRKAIRKFGQPVHDENDIFGMIEAIKNDLQWEFEFYAVSSPKQKEKMKSQALSLGFQSREIKTFLFEGKQMHTLLKTIRKSMNKSSGKSDEVPVCKKCPKGRQGKTCRKRRKSRMDLGQCRME